MEIDPLYRQNTPLKEQQSGLDGHGASNWLQKDAMQCQKIPSHKNRKTQLSLEPGRGDKYIIAIFSKAEQLLLARNTRVIEGMNFWSTSPVTRILCFGMICSLHMFTKTILPGFILSCWLFIYDTVQATSCHKPGYPRGCPNVRCLHEREGEKEHTCSSLFPH